MKRFNWYILKGFFESEGYRQVDIWTRDYLYFHHSLRGIKFGFEKSNNIGMVMAVVILKKAGLGYGQLIEYTETLKHKRELEKP